MAGLGIVGIALLVSGWRAVATDGRTGLRLARAFAAAGLVVVLSVLVVSPRLERLEKDLKKGRTPELEKELAAV